MVLNVEQDTQIDEDSYDAMFQSLFGSEVIDLDASQPVVSATGASSSGLALSDQFFEAPGLGCSENLAAVPPNLDRFPGPRRR